MVTLTSVRVGSVLCYYRSCIAYTLIYTLSLSLSHIQKTAEISMHISETQIAIYLYIFFLLFAQLSSYLCVRVVSVELCTQRPHTYTRAHTFTHILSRRQRRHKHIATGRYRRRRRCRRAGFLFLWSISREPQATSTAMTQTVCVCVQNKRKKSTIHIHLHRQST